MSYHTFNSSSHYSVSSESLCKVILNSDEYLVNPGISSYLPIVIVVVIIAPVTLVSNGAFLLVTFKSQRLQIVHNILLISLSVTDFFTGAVVTPISAASFVFLMNKKYPCQLFWVWIISFNAVSITSFSTLALISFEKYLAIIHPFFYQRTITKTKLILMAIGVRLFATTFALAGDLIGLSYPVIRRLFWVYVPYLGLIFYIAIFYCYGRIFREIRRVRRRIITVENTFKTDSTATRNNSNAAKTTLIVIGAITISYLPYITAYILWPSSETELTARKLESLLKLSATVIILFNSTLNPIIYCIRMSLVRKEFKHIFFLKSGSP